jgi:pSer/pThr/pTyr-binding forkhead associated (FHA) protein
MAQLKINHEEYSELFDLETKSSVTIGRYDPKSLKQCDILLDYQHVSRRHCTVILMVRNKGFFWTIRDGVLDLKKPNLKSANGTYINGNLIAKITKLNDGDTITFSHKHYYPSIQFLNEPTTEIITEKDTIEHEYEN